MAASSPRTVASPLADALERAVDRGVITPEQATAIVAAESGHGEVSAAVAGADEVAGHRGVGPLVAEALGYVGVALATIATILVAQRSWAELEPWARVGLLALLSVGLLALGLVLRPSSGPVARVRGLAWLLSVVALAATLAVAGEEYLDLVPERLTAAVASTCALYATVLWWLWARTLQQLAVFVAVTVAASTGVVAVDRSLTVFVGLTVWSIGVAWIALTWGQVVRPLRAGYVLGAIAVVIGPRLSFEEVLWPLALGVVSGVLLIVASMVLRAPILLGAGVVGLFIHVPLAVFEVFGDTLGAPVSLFITGVVLVAVALVLARLRPGRQGGSS